LHDKSGFEYENVYNAWMEWIANISSSLPYMVTVGNHESECHSPACLSSPRIIRATKNFSAYNKRFRMPSDVSGGVQNMWYSYDYSQLMSYYTLYSLCSGLCRYSYDYGYVHFIALNTETDFVGAAEEIQGDSGLLPAGRFGFYYAHRANRALNTIRHAPHT
jgi:hypothetical protein